MSNERVKGSKGNSPALGYRDLVQEALDSVAVYNRRADWFEQQGNSLIALEYRELSQAAVARAKRYEALAVQAEKQNWTPD